MNTSMKLIVRSLVLSLALFAAQGFAQAADSEGAQLVRIKTHKVDQASLLPGGDFSRYKKVMIAPSEVTLQKNWVRTMNNFNVPLSNRITEEDATKIVTDVRAGFDEIWVKAFKSAGYEVVTAPGDDVLKLTPVVFDLFINAPDVPGAVRTKSYTIEAGEASLSLDARDSVSGALLGRIIDKRTAGDHAGRFEWTTRVSNRADFDRLFGQWAKIAADGLGELAHASPVPQNLQPNQKLPTKS
jgi:hypothetical protein